MDFKGKTQTIEFEQAEIADRVSQLGKKIAADYQGEKLMVISILRGSFIFVADLVRAIDYKICVEFIRASSYEDRFETSGNVELLTGIDRDITGFHVLLVDDIIDSGVTISFVYDYIQSLRPKSVKICSLLDKPSRRRVEITPDYVGFEIEDKFIVGYGLNYGDYYRNVPYIFSLK